MNHIKTIFKPYGFIYITTNLINGKRYIGQKKYDVRGEWKTYLGSGIYLQRAIKKYGIKCFIRDTVCLGYSKKELNELETHLILLYDATHSDEFYNISRGGDGSNLEHQSEETKNKLRESKKAENLSDETRKKLSESKKGENHHFYGKFLSQEHKNKLSDIRKGENHHMYGKQHSDDTKIKISKSQIGKRCYGENQNAKKVICLTTKESFDSIKEASEFYKCSNSGIVNCCKGKIKSSGKTQSGVRLRWIYYKDYLNLEMEAG